MFYLKLFNFSDMDYVFILLIEFYCTDKLSDFFTYTFKFIKFSNIIQLTEYLIISTNV